MTDIYGTFLAGFGLIQKQNHQQFFFKDCWIFISVF